MHLFPVRRPARRPLVHGLLVVGLLALTATLGACSLLPADLGGAAAPDGEAGVPYPAGCAQFSMTDRQCAFVVDQLGASLGVDRTHVREITLLGDPGCGHGVGSTDDGSTVLCARTMQFLVRVRFVGDDGMAVEDSQFCGVGGDFTLACTDPPLIKDFAPTTSGYYDVPCAGEPPDGCASPVATIDPAVATKGRAFRLGAIDVPLDHVGHYDIALGTAVLPNGVLTEGTFALPDNTQRGFLLVDGVLRLAISGPDGKLIWNVYEQGWRPGTETVDIHLVFDVASADPGATIRVRDVVVR